MPKDISQPRERDDSRSDEPLVSILMVARNAESHIVEALASASAQTWRKLEIVVVDDGSTDETAAIVRRQVGRDSRIRLCPGPGRGLAAVRNHSLDVAKGRYAAILDSDDMIHPRHVEWLVRGIRDRGARMVAANMVEFTRGARPTASLFAAGPSFVGKREISRLEFVQAGDADRDGPSLGYLKPMFDMDFMREKDLRYRETLRIGEDYDLVDRALAAGGTFLFLPAPTYFYRKHDQSTSHRLTDRDLEAMAEAAHATASAGPELAAAITARSRSIEKTRAHLRTVTALKQRDIGEAARLLLGQPSLLVPLAKSALEGMSRRTDRVAGRLTASKQSDAPNALIIGDGNKDRLDAFVRDLKRKNWTMHLASPRGFRDAIALSTQCPKIDLLVVRDDEALEMVPFALSPFAPIVDLRKEQGTTDAPRLADAQ